MSEALRTLAGPVSPAESYRLCRQVVRRSSSNLARSFWLLPAGQRRGMYALYAFSRTTDDLADSPELSRDRRSESLAQWRQALAGALAGQANHPLLPALADSAQRFDIPHQYFFDLIEGVGMDLVKNRYETFDELLQYCYRVASVVGLACVRIWGCRRPEAQEPAIRCGYALQLTNILRDLAEDAARNRIYLPAEDLRRCGCSADDLRAGLAGEPLTRVVLLLADRAESFYDEAADLQPLLPPAGRRMFRLMTGTYRRLLGKIRRLGAGVLHQRAALGTWEKAALAWSALQAGSARPLRQSAEPLSGGGLAPLPAAKRQHG